MQKRKNVECNYVRWLEFNGATAAAAAVAACSYSTNPTTTICGVPARVCAGVPLWLVYALPRRETALLRLKIPVGTVMYDTYSRTAT